MAKSKSPKANDDNEAAQKVVENMSGPVAGESAEVPVKALAPKTEPAKGKTTPKAVKAKTTATAKTKTRGVKSSRPKLEAVLSEARANGGAPSGGDARGNVVPINLEDEIRKVAYLLSERRGFAPGHEREDWLAAEREVMQRYRQHSA